MQMVNFEQESLNQSYLWASLSDPSGRGSRNCCERDCIREGTVVATSKKHLFDPSSVNYRNNRI